MNILTGVLIAVISFIVLRNMAPSIKGPADRIGPKKPPKIGHNQIQDLEDGFVHFMDLSDELLELEPLPAPRKYGKQRA